MTSEARIAANRRNAEKSTGPKTDEGKAASSRNALKHGLTAEQVVVFDEDPADFMAFRDEMRATLDPVDAVEEMLAERIVSCAWRLRRAGQIEGELLMSMTQHPGGPPCEGLGQAFLMANSYIQVLGRYETALDRALEKAYKLLDQRQAKRRGEAIEAARAASVDELANKVAEILLDEDRDFEGDDGPAALPAQSCETNPMAAAQEDGDPDEMTGDHPIYGVPLFGTKPMRAGPGGSAKPKTALELAREGWAPAK